LACPSNCPGDTPAVGQPRSRLQQLRQLRRQRCERFVNRVDLVGETAEPGSGILGLRPDRAEIVAHVPDRQLDIGHPLAERLGHFVEARIDRLERLGELGHRQRELLLLFLQHPQLRRHLLLLTALRHQPRRPGHGQDERQDCHCLPHESATSM
jgi:hypothetical protein